MYSSCVLSANSLILSPGAQAQQGRAILRPIAPPIGTPRHPFQLSWDRIVQLGAQICYRQAGVSYPAW